MNTPIQMLWIGKKINRNCIACISSFLDHEHEVHLYLYEPTETILPRDLIIKDAREIMSEEEIFFCQTEPGLGSPSPFSDFFRWKLLRDRGGWWVDTDVACVRYWDFDKEVVLAGERSYIFNQYSDYELGDHYATCVMKLPKGHDLAEKCYNYCMSLNKSEVTWTQPAIDILNKYAEPNGWEDPKVFCPIFWNEWEQLFESEYIPEKETYGVHLWNEMQRRSEPKMPKENSFIQMILNKEIDRRWNFI